MNRDSGSEHPSQRTVAELLAEYGAGSQRNAHRRRRRAEDPTETAPHAIIDRVLSDSGTMRPIDPDAEPPRPTNHRPAPPAAPAAKAPPAPQAPPAPPNTPPAQQAPPEQAPAGPPNGPGAGEEPKASGTFWSRRFASSGGPRPKAPAQPEQPSSPDAADPEATAQQPLPTRAQPHPRASSAAAPAPAAEPPAPPPVAQPAAPTPTPPMPPPAQPPPAQVSPAPSPQESDGLTEQIPRLEQQQVDDVPVAEGEGTAMLAYPTGPESPPDKTQYEDPYDYGYDSYNGYGDDGFDDDDYDAELPAGMAADDYVANDYDEDDEDDEDASSPGKEWLILGAQVGVAVLGGGLVWVGFRWLWMSIPVAALVAALVVTGALVLIARKFLRSDDLQTILLAVLVGLTCTVSPAALLLVGH